MEHGSNYCGMMHFSLKAVFSGLKYTKIEYCLMFEYLASSLLFSRRLFGLDACEDKTSPSARGISTNDLDSMKARARHMAKIAMFPSVWDDDGIPRQM